MKKDEYATVKYTQCTRCSAVFQVDDNKLGVKKGEVRCGICRTVFNARESMVVKNKIGGFIPVQKDIFQQSVLRDTQCETDQEIVFDQQEVSNKRSQNDDIDSINQEPVANKTELEDMNPFLKKEKTEEPIVTLVHEGKVERDMDAGTDLETIDSSLELNKQFHSGSDDLLPHNPFSHSRVIEDNIDGPINMSGVDAYIIDRPNPVIRIGWLFVCLVFIVLLSFQIRYYFVDRYAQDENIRPALNAFCLVAFCELPARQDWFRFTITNTRVDLHPLQPGAIRITVKVLNQANFAQTYPELQLTLTDRLGRVVGRRTFTPEFFLVSNQGKILNSGELGTVVLDLAKPHDKAVGFEMKILKQPTLS